MAGGKKECDYPAPAWYLADMAGIRNDPDMDTVKQFDNDMRSRFGEVWYRGSTSTGKPPENPVPRRYAEALDRFDGIIRRGAPYRNRYAMMEYEHWRGNLARFRTEHGIGPERESLLRFLWLHMSLEYSSDESDGGRFSVPPPDGLFERLLRLSPWDRKAYADWSAYSMSDMNPYGTGCLAYDASCVREYLDKYGDPGRPDDPEMLRINTGIRYGLCPREAHGVDYIENLGAVTRDHPAVTTKPWTKIYPVFGTDVKLYRGRLLWLLGPWPGRDSGDQGDHGRCDIRIDGALVMDALLTGHTGELPEELRSMLDSYANGTG